MPKPAASQATVLMKELRTLLETRVEERLRPATGPSTRKNAMKVLGLPPSAVRATAREFLVEGKGPTDYASAVELLGAAIERKTREEILLAGEMLEAYRREIEPGLLSRLDKWVSVADDLEVAEVLGARIAATALAVDPTRIATVRKWARMKSPGRKRLALLAATGLVTEGRRDAGLALDLCEILLNEEHPVLVSEVAALLRDTTKIDAKAVQDFLFRRSIDGNPQILRAGSENLDAARRAALIAKLEAQAAPAAVAPVGGR